MNESNANLTEHVKSNEVKLYPCFILNCCYKRSQVPSLGTSTNKPLSEVLFW